MPEDFFAERKRELKFAIGNAGAHSMKEVEEFKAELKNLESFS